MANQYWAHPINRPKNMVGPFDSRVAAIEVAITKYPKAKEITSGYGTFGPSFDIRWNKADLFLKEFHTYD
jgi:hypothetical protein